jgi:hypothetical protein
MRRPLAQRSTLDSNELIGRTYRVTDASDSPPQALRR